MDREKVIRETASPKLLSEIEDLLEMALSEEWESVETLEDAFRETFEKAESISEWKALLTPCRKVGIALGDYVIMGAEEIKNTVVWPKGNPWDFKLGGVAYKPK